MTKSYIIKNKFGVLYFKDKGCTIIHREDGPAMEWDNGTKEWFINGLYHRMNGPAVEYSGGSKEWYLNGEQYSEEEYKRIVKMINFL